MADRAVEPFAVAQMVETYVDSELRDAAKYTNREPLDDSGVYGLHDLAARIYALGFISSPGSRSGSTAATRRRWTPNWYSVVVSTSSWSARSRQSAAPSRTTEGFRVSDKIWACLADIATRFPILPSVLADALDEHGGDAMAWAWIDGPKILRLEVDA